MKILVACEESGTVSNKFYRLGHDVTSCDLYPSKFINHYQGNVLDIINNGFDLMIAFPPCTYLTVANNRNWEIKKQEQLKAFEFVKLLWNANIPKIAIENPVGWLNTNWQPCTQIIHPYYFGEPYSKRTCLWLKNLPLLKYNLNDTLFEQKTSCIPLRKFTNTVRGSVNRSKTFQCIANAMCKSWG
jgi:site-specific DNA-cytosine methylase